MTATRTAAMTATMSANLRFSLALAALVGTILLFGLRILPRENMQILASVPVRRRSDGRWLGVNLTWYGVMQMTAVVVATALAVVLAVSAGVAGRTIGLALALVLAVGLPAARLLARIVEGKRDTFTVGGAVCAVTLLLPWAAWAVDGRHGGHVLAIMTAVAVAYPVGEGIGRLACVSFGCCYGRRVDQSAPWLRRLFAGRAAVVVGPTRKAAYAGNCAGVPLLPVPALSACVLSAGGALAVPFFLAGHIRTAGLLVVAIVFPWRVVSEFLRADYRGAQRSRLSAYQWMALLSLAYALPVLAVLPAELAVPDVGRGLSAMGSPLAWLALAGLGTVVFAYLGVSKKTTAIIDLGVKED
jgi:prolipoprotein diacylglyceryltransferase